MLPTSPRLAARSMSSSCATPAASTATRVSCGVTLMRSSSLTRADFFQKLTGFIEGQAHDAGIAAAQLDHEARGTALDGVGARLVVAFAACHVLADLLFGKRLEAHLRARQRLLQPLVVLERDGGEH